MPPDTSPASRPASGPSLRAFVAEHSLALTRFAYLLCGDHQLAEDLVQETFVALHRRFGAVLDVEAPVAYARRAIVNANTSRLRRRASAEVVTAQLPETPAPGVGHDEVGELDAMWRLLDTLPDRQRAVLVLRYASDLPDAAIAELLDCREGTVRSLATRAFATLREHPSLRRDRAERADRTDRTDAEDR